ncbi:MAG: hypothetical protein K9K64_16825 [Desulfohalobiaceae bacterium]|nr:hypothetical protein [Desulfohalobiaceae bacterium]
MDTLWLRIVALVESVAGLLDRAIDPLHVLGPGPVIFLLVLVTVGFTKFFSRVYGTKRHQELKKEFQHWHGLRQEALKAGDREKGGRLARNIDQARLNKIYYDYFFEGLLKNILTIYLPILLMAGYVDSRYRPRRLLEDFGREYVFRIPTGNGEPVGIGALFWFVVCLILVYSGWSIAAGQYRKRK